MTYNIRYHLFKQHDEFGIFTRYIVVVRYWKGDINDAIAQLKDWLEVGRYANTLYDTIIPHMSNCTMIALDQTIPSN